LILVCGYIINNQILEYYLTITNGQTPIKYVKGELKHVLQKGIDSSLYDFIVIRHLHIAQRRGHIFFE
jgi:hypothetical protein